MGCVREFPHCDIVNVAMRSKRRRPTDVSLRAGHDIVDVMRMQPDDVFDGGGEQDLNDESGNGVVRHGANVRGKLSRTCGCEAYL